MNRFFRLPALSLSFLLTLVLAACVQNPVTGKRDLLVVSEAWELQVGAQQYLPLRQAQGGDYVADPAVEQYVQRVGARLAAVSDRDLPYEFHVINDSTPNAWALPGGKISINRGLLVRLKSEAELAAVLGHEIVHAAAKHGAKGQTRSLGLQLGVMTASILGAREGYGQLAQLASTVGAQIINSRYGQGAELEADRYGMQYMSEAGFDPSGAVELQRTFVELSKDRPSDPISRLFASHPPSEKRVAENMRTAQALGSGGSVGADRYAKAMARLNKTRDAYESFELAQKAFKANDTAKASSLLQKAIRIEPREAHFHSLVGDIALARKNLSSARRSYDKAISLNNQFYYYYLKRGQLFEQQRNVKAARADYERSMKLLPTSVAQLGLGQFAEQSGDTRKAKAYYAMAAQAQGEEASRAKAALLRLDPPTNPQSSLQINYGLTPQGTFAVELINRSPRAIANVQLGLQTVPGTPPRVQTMPGVLPPGQRRIVDTGRRLSARQARDVKVTVIDLDYIN